jgi:hypothetical protein
LMFSPKSQLRALSISQITLMSSPAVVSAHTRLTHLRLRGMPYLSTPTVADLVACVARTLRCLELDEVNTDAYAALLEHIVPLLRTAPALEELGIIALSSYPSPPDWTAQDLVRPMPRAIQSS